MTIPQTFEAAIQHHLAGRLAEAEALYRQILVDEPHHAEALHLLGVIAQQVGQHDVAVELIRRAIALQPGYAEAHNNLGVALKEMGRSDEAMAAFRQALALQPAYPEARSNLGTLLYDKGQLDAAVAEYHQAIAHRPGYAEAHYNLGNALKDKSEWDAAVAEYHRAIALQPGHAETYNNLGIVLHHKGQSDEAMAAFRQVLVLQPGHAKAHINLGNALKDKGKLDAAVAEYHRAIALQPGHAEAHNNLGIVLYDMGQPAAAMAAFRQAIALRPGDPEAHYNLGNTLKDNDQWDAAMAEYRQAIALKSDYLEAYNNLGNSLKEQGQWDEAIAAYRQAIAFKPDYLDAYNNLGLALKDQGRLDEAIAACRRAIALKHDYAEGHFNLAHTLLLQGNLGEAWKEYEWRWKCEAFSSPQRNFPQPQWDGAPLEGGALLLHAEQGLGDAIQFIRYGPLARQRGGRIIIECQPELQRLFQRMAPDLPVVAKGQALPAFEAHCPLLSLPGIFATDLGSIPQTVPYLQADLADARIWRKRLAGDVTSFKAGLVWAGNPTHTNDRNRSLKLASLAPLADLSGVQFYSLQKGEAATEARTPPRGMELVDAAEKLEDFADTAALIANLDLVIAVDTAVVHLAGAMGKPVWTLLSFAPDWRWLLGRTASPWYPTMRLFRQPKIGDWDTVIAEVCEQLRLLVQKRRDAS